MSKEIDPCGTVGPTQRWAFVWFFSVIAIGSSLVFGLSRIDRFNYDTKGVYLDYDKYRENRKAIVSIPSERVDKRAQSLFSTK